MDATEGVIPPSCDYAGWEDSFCNDAFDKCMPLVEQDAARTFQSLCAGVAELENTQAEAAFYGLDGYNGLFTIQLKGSQETLLSILPQIVSGELGLVAQDLAGFHPEETPHLVWDEYQAPWQIWLSRGHSLPFWPPVIEAA